MLILCTFFFSKLLLKIQSPVIQYLKAKMQKSLNFQVTCCEMDGLRFLTDSNGKGSQPSSWLLIFIYSFLMAATMVTVASCGSVEISRMYLRYICITEAGY